MCDELEEVAGASPVTVPSSPAEGAHESGCSTEREGDGRHSSCHHSSSIASILSLRKAEVRSSADGSCGKLTASSSNDSIVTTRGRLHRRTWKKQRRDAQAGARGSRGARERGFGMEAR